MMRFGIVLLASLDFAVFAVALRLLFTRGGRTPRPTRLLVLIGSAFSCLHVYLLATAPLKAFPVIAGAVLYGLAGGLFTWAAFSIRGREFRLAYAPSHPSSVFSGGPFRWLRHPFYLSYSLAWCAGVVALADPRLLLTLAIMLSFYGAAAWREEQQMLRGAAASQYRAYRRQAGVLLPRVLRPSRLA